MTFSLVMHRYIIDSPFLLFVSPMVGFSAAFMTLVIRVVNVSRMEPHQSWGFWLMANLMNNRQWGDVIQKVVY